MLRSIALATLVAGTLDILSAFVFAGMAGIGPGAVLRYVASGPFGDAVRTGGAGWTLAGLAVHFAIMGCMATAYFLIAARGPQLVARPFLAGFLYGLLLWVIMYWVVKPLRWPTAPLPHTAWGVSNALFSHCILVGIPIALIAARHFTAHRPTMPQPA
ncbi:MAG TPA: hypothetical protein VH331_04650 [Allosphingosinicella sp.]|jgi:hypothetical protein|nr:hypothetical protein [Allosphingosinicella sp.]